MRKRLAFLLAASLVLVALGFARDKAFAKDKKPILPPYVLQAKTVTVMIDPAAGISIEDPQANRVAQDDVESALLNWGKFQPVLSTQAADLIIVVRKGSGRMVSQTLANPRQNSRICSIDQGDSSMSAGAQHGQQPGFSGGPGMGPGPHPQTEIGEADDSFVVYRGGVEDPLDASPAWRFTSKDGLRPHTVPAVAEFRKAVADAEKAAAKNP
jgi:hypothetical protein